MKSNQWITRTIIAISVLALNHKYAYAQNPIVLKNAVIIDGSAKVKPQKGSILIENGYIKAVYKADKILPKHKYQIIDCEGKFITPGLTDSHVHLATFKKADSLKAIPQTDSILANFVQHGILTVRDMAGDAIFLNKLRTSINKAAQRGPDIFYAAQFAGSSYFNEMRKHGDPNLGLVPWYKAIDHIDQIGSAVKEAKTAGVSGIKIYDSLNKELIQAITKAGKKAGLKIWSHATVFPTKPIYVARAGVTTMSHAHDLIFQQMESDSISSTKAWNEIYKKRLKADSIKLSTLLAAIKKHKVILDATVFPATQNKMMAAQEITRMAHNYGIKISTGTDWIYPTQNDKQPLQSELELLNTKCNMSTIEVIEACVKNGPEAIGLKDRGLIRKGQLAHLLILNSNPLTDLSALFHPEKVIKKGKIVFSRN